MVFFKRLSRSRSNSQSYVDSYDARHDSKASYDEQKYHSGPVVTSPADIDPDHDQGVPVSRQSNSAPQIGDHLVKDTGELSMYSRRDRPTEVSTQDRYHSNTYANPPPATFTAQRPRDAPRTSPLAPNFCLNLYGEISLSVIDLALGK